MTIIQIMIQDNPNNPFRCKSDWTIGDAEARIRQKYQFTGGVIKLNNKSTLPSKTFHEYITNKTDIVFTFVNGTSTLPTLSTTAPGKIIFDQFLFFLLISAF